MPSSAPKSRGFDGGKLVNGRKRHVVVDTLGLLLGVMVTAADTGDRMAAKVHLGQVTDEHYLLALVWADGGYTGSLVEYCLGRVRPGAVDRQAQRRHVRLRGAAQAVDRGASLRPSDAKSRPVRDFKRRAPKVMSTSTPRR
jgi:transposase